MYGASVMLILHTRNPVQTKQLGPFRFLLHEWNLKNTRNKKSIEGMRNNLVWNRISTQILSELRVFRSTELQACFFSVSNPDTSADAKLVVRRFNPWVHSSSVSIGERGSWAWVAWQFHYCVQPYQKNVFLKFCLFDCLSIYWCVTFMEYVRIC